MPSRSHFISRTLHFSVKVAQCPCQELHRPFSSLFSYRWIVLLVCVPLAWRGCQLRLIAGPRGKPEAEVFTGKHERLFTFWSRTRGREKEGDGSPAGTFTECPSLELQATMNAKFETGLPSNDEGIFIKVEG